MSEGARQVVEQFNEIVKPEGGSVTLLSDDGGISSNSKITRRSSMNRAA